MKPQTMWASVAVVFILVASATTLVSLGKDVAIILELAGLVAVPVLGAFGVAVYHKLDQVKETSNGTNAKILEAANENTKRMMEMQQRTQEQWQETQKQLTTLALAIAPPQMPTSAPPATDEKPEDGHTAGGLGW